MASKKRASTKEAKPVKATPGKRVYVSAENMPRKTLEDAILIVKKLHEIYHGKSATRDELASVIGSAANTPKTHYLLRSAVAYGIVKDDGNNVYSLAEPGRKIVAPTYEGEDKEAFIKAVMTPATLSKFYSDYNGHSIPAQQHLANLLETRYAIPRERTAEAIEIIRANGIFAGILDESQNTESPVVHLGQGSLRRKQLMKVLVTARVPMARPPWRRRRVNKPPMLWSGNGSVFILRQSAMTAPTSESMLISC